MHSAESAQTRHHGSDKRCKNICVTQRLHARLTPFFRVVLQRSNHPNNEETGFKQKQSLPHWEVELLLELLDQGDDSEDGQADLLGVLGQYGAACRDGVRVGLQQAANIEIDLKPQNDAILRLQASTIRTSTPSSSLSLSPKISCGQFSLKAAKRFR